jgi:hypothetical protein
MKRLMALVLSLALALPALAHKPSDAYLTLQRDGARLAGQWDLALRDLELAIGVDADGDGDITWGEVRARHGAIGDYAMRRLAASSDGERCALRVAGHQIDTHTDGTYAVVMLAGECPRVASSFTIEYSALFDVDPQHRGLLNFVDGGESSSFIFSAAAPRQSVGRDAAGALRQFAAYVGEGIWHIGVGFDHFLFLVSLLLPAVLVRRAGVWQPVADFRSAFWDVFRVVTSFTLAHSLTLTLAMLEFVTLPSRFVESAIAASVVLAALNNIVPIVDRGRWIVAFGFGLVHGFGFAGALQGLGLPRGSLALSLAGFNVGVELGQLAIVVVFLPAAFAVRGTFAYRRLIVAAGSAAIVVLAGAWLVERAFDMSVLARFALAGG